MRIRILLPRGGSKYANTAQMIGIDNCTEIFKKGELFCMSGMEEEYYDIFKSEEEYKKQMEIIDGLARRYGVKTILDAGCGTGKLAWLLHRRGYSVTGFDSDPGMIRKAQRKYQGIDFFQDDVRTFALDCSYDAVIATDSVPTFLSEHTEAYQAISNMLTHARVLVYCDLDYTQEHPPEAGESTNTIRWEGKLLTYHSITAVGKDRFTITGKILDDEQLVWREETTRLLLSEKRIQELLQQYGWDIELRHATREGPIEISATRTDTAHR